MSTKLQKIIRYYEAERGLLTAQLAECIAEDDYGTARRLSKGVTLVNQRLQTLLNLHDGRHDENERVIRLLQMLEESMGSQTSIGSQKFYAEQILAVQKQLVEFERPPVKPSASPKATALNDALRRLLDKQIESFTFVFNQAERFNIVVNRVRRTVMITLPEVKRHAENYLLTKKQIRNIKSLGFRLYDNGDKFILFLPYTTILDASSVQHVLLRIAFEIFYFKEFTGQSRIKYWEI
ncbi:hypothetical protein [Hymenobacter arizonensis]|uniref:Uncharacterized protein n=1 Tax=Hymenobacter arizonensis TaxID=1227077 RepID=A0A1I5UF61_HYMAR|nr:hypothetical protein [Hymenobacter arizonensis]SFP93892.1 hypothetical protein SAMN04515668_0896 [Hymenobacter arizonensis]